MADLDEPGKMSRRGLLKAAAAAGVVGVAAKMGLGIEAAKRPNFILLLADDMRADFMSCAGHPILKTPNIDALAGGGVRFTNAFAPSAICVTSRAGILTGMFPATHGVHDFATPMKSEIWKQSFPMLLREAGYRTGFVGKWGIDGGALPKSDYDYFEGYAGQGRYFEPGSSQHLTAKQGEQAVEFLRGCKGDEPFCLQVSFKSPHVQDEGRNQPGIYAKYPYDPAYHWKYRDVKTPVVVTKDKKPLPEMFGKSMNCRREGPDFSESTYQETLQHLYRLHAGVDDAVGKILSSVKERGMEENTVIIFASDHGSFYGEHGFGGKWLMFEEAIRIPCIVFDPSLPKAQRGTTSDETTLNIDLPATILDRAGVKKPQTMQGESLLRTLNGQSRPKWNDWYYQQTFANGPSEPILASEGVRNEGWKYISYLGSAEPYEQLFDLKADPREENNLAEDPSAAAMLQQMRDRNNAWKKSLQVLS